MAVHYTDKEYASFWSRKYSDAGVSKAVTKIQDLSVEYMQNDIGAVAFFEQAIADLTVMHARLIGLLDPK